MHSQKAGQLAQSVTVCLMPEEHWLKLGKPSCSQSSLFSTIQRISLYLFSKSGHEGVLKVEVIFEDPISTSVGYQILSQDVNF